MSGADAKEISLHCGACKAQRQFSSKVVCMVVWMPHLVTGWHILEPSDELRICLTCKNSKFNLVDRCVRLHPATASGVEPWTMASIVFADGQGMTVKSRHTQPILALA